MARCPLPLASGERIRRRRRTGAAIIPSAARGWAIDQEPGAEVLLHCRAVLSHAPRLGFLDELQCPDDRVRFTRVAASPASSTFRFRCLHCLGLFRTLDGLDLSLRELAFELRHGAAIGACPRPSQMRARKEPLGAHLQNDVRVSATQTPFAAICFNIGSVSIGRVLRDGVDPYERKSTGAVSRTSSAIVGVEDGFRSNAQVREGFEAETSASGASRFPPR